MSVEHNYTSMTSSQRVPCSKYSMVFLCQARPLRQCQESRSGRLTWESKVGLSILAFTKMRMWFFTMKGLTTIFLCFFAISATRNLRTSNHICHLLVQNMAMCISKYTERYKV